MTFPDTNISSLADGEHAYSTEAPGINVTSPEHRPMDGTGTGQKVKAEAGAKASKQGESASPELLFERPDYLDFIDLGRLPKKAGVSRDMLQHLIVKELSDNALDACDRAERPGAVEISVDADGNLIVADQGTGINKAPLELATDVYCVNRPMVSSKLLRKASRGAIGNGLRCCMGWITATQGMLQVRTGRYRATLKPERDGKTYVVEDEEIDPLPGTWLKVIAGEQRFETKHLAWVTDAIELAR